MRKTAGYTWTDYKTNTEIAKELYITPVFDTIQKKLERRVNIMSRKRLSGIIKNCTTRDRRSQKRFLDVRDQNRSTSGPTP
jgi:hypothetical protein